MTEGRHTAVVDLQRLLCPRHVALVGGKWADAAADAATAIGYAGKVWRVHPSRPSGLSAQYFRSVEDLPEAPDAAFIAAPNHEVPTIAAALARRGAGGFVCFASGFSEAGTDEGRRLTASLEAAAGNLPYFGPNCYGFINFFDGVALWPDQVVGERTKRGVAIISQSGTIALDMLFNQRSLSIGYVITVGNQTRIAVEDLLVTLANDSRITAFGLYVEGILDMPRFASAVASSQAAGKQIALVKAGRTEAAARTAHSHTGALAGPDEAFDAFCRQAGIARCDSLATLCETLKVFHVSGPLRGRRMLVMGASGGDMAMSADVARHLAIDFPSLPSGSARALEELLTSRVAVSNPFDFHTHVWFDRLRLHALFEIAQGAGYDIVGLMIDCPPASSCDPSSYLGVIEEFIGSYTGSGASAAIISSMPESLPEGVRADCLRHGVVPLQGQREALEAISNAMLVGSAVTYDSHVQLRTPRRPGGRRAEPERPGVRALSEREGKMELARYGVQIPKSRVVTWDRVADVARELGFPVVVKVAGAFEHKSDIGGVVVNVQTAAEAEDCARQLSKSAKMLMVEEMITDGVVEILVGVKVDPQFGLLLVVGAGGVLAELLRDTAMLLPPFTSVSVRGALRGLRIGKLLSGYRRRPAADLPALVDAILGCARYAEEHLDSLIEFDVNPVIVRPSGQGAVAVDALIRLMAQRK